MRGFFDRDGETQELEADGLLATALQHEIDHLNGVLFIDYLSRLKRERVDQEIRQASKTRHRRARDAATSNRKLMRVIFMGTPQFAVPALNAIIGHAHEVIAVYTRGAATGRATPGPDGHAFACATNRGTVWKTGFHAKNVA